MDGSEAHRQRQWRPPQLVNHKAGHNPLLCSPSLNKARQKYNFFLKYLWFSYVTKKMHEPAACNTRGTLAVKSCRTASLPRKNRRVDRNIICPIIYIMLSNVFRNTNSFLL